jgi:WD40 repeat protein
MPIIIAHFAPRSSRRIFAAIYAPFDFRRFAENAGFDEGAYVEADAVVEVGIPADGLFFERLPANEDVVGCFAFAASFSPDGRRIVTGSNDKTARVWDAESGKPMGEPVRHQREVYLASFSPDGRRIVTGSYDETARVWDAESGKPVGEPMRHENTVTAASFSPDGRRIITGSWDTTARVWDAESGKPVSEPMRHESAVNAASFSPDGRRIVTASNDNTARVWDAESGKPLGEPMRHEDWVTAATFSPDGQRIVTGSRDKTARVWDAESGKPLGEPMRHEDTVNAASFSPDGRRIVTGSRDKTARVWHVAVDLESPLPAWIPELAEALGQQSFNDEGVLVQPKKSIVELRRELLALEGDDFWSRLGRWFFMRGPQRTISPDSKITVGELTSQQFHKTTEAKPTKE